MANIYKPRYKICYQTKNKIWINKNSRLRNFYNIRNKVVLEKRSWKIKNTIVTKNMKWTVARRLMVPYVKTKSYFAYNYKNSLYLKQQLKNFYGKLKEHQLRKIFKRTWTKEQHFRKDIFISSLEQRLDMVFFRMRLLPTIFACHQFIDHKGLLVNNKLVTLPSYKVKIGDIVSLQENVWSIFYDRLLYKLKKRFCGNVVLIWRKQQLLNKMEYLTMPTYHHFYVKILQQVFFNKKLYKVLKNYTKNQYSYFNEFNTNSKELAVLSKKNKNFFKILHLILVKRIYFQFKKITIKNLRKLANNQLDKDYYRNFNKILTRNYNISKMFNLIYFVLYQQILNWHTQKAIIDIKNSRLSTDKKLKLILLLNFEKNNKIEKEYNIYLKKQELLLKNFKIYIKKVYSKFLNLKYNSNINFINNRAILKLISELKKQKKKQIFFKDRLFKHHWYIPNYLEVDYRTLRASFVYYPSSKEVHYGFPCSIDTIISFYKERAL